MTNGPKDFGPAPSNRQREWQPPPPPAPIAAPLARSESPYREQAQAPTVDHSALAVAAFNRAMDSIESAKRELTLGRSELALIDAARALQAAGAAHFHVAHLRGEP